MKKVTSVIIAMTLIFAMLVFETSNAQIINTIVGGLPQGYSGDGGPAVNAQVMSPMGGCTDVLGNIYFADNFNNRIRKIDFSTGIISTIAGNGFAGFSGDSGLAINARLNSPWGVCVDDSGNIYIADYWNFRIRKVTVSTGIITTVVGTGDILFSGDGGQATSAGLGAPLSACCDASRNIFIATISSRIRKVNVLTGIITTVAGTGFSGFLGDNGLAVDAQIFLPHSVCVDVLNNIYIADGVSNQRIRKIDGSTGIITTIAGDGFAGNSGDGGLAINAELYNPSGVSVDAEGNVYIADQFNNKVRKINAVTGIITTIVGTGVGGFSGDGGPAANAQLQYPGDVFFDRAGNLYISDRGNIRIRKVSLGTVVPVSLINFKATTHYKIVAITWTTTSQVNNKYFEVQRSSNGIDWQGIGKVNGCGSCSVTMEYNFIDQHPYTGISYYRLKQFDADGKFTYSTIAKVFYSSSTVTVSPTVTTGACTVSGISAGQVVQVYAMDGGLLFSKTAQGNLMDINLSGYPSGVYILKTKDFSTKVVKQ